MADYLPPEVLVDIFMRLPTETIVRVAFVCKAWNFLITSPKFIALHLNRNADDRLLLVRYRTSETKTIAAAAALPSGSDHCSEHQVHFSLVLDGNDSFPQLKSLDLPFHSLGYSIVGSVNGVICLSNDLEYGYVNDMVLWNPSIRKFVALPKYNVTFQSHGPHQHCLGFGFDPVANDFKVVRIVHTDFYDTTPLVEIYSHKTGRWRYIRDKALPLRTTEQCRQAYVNGTANWLAFAPGTPSTPCRDTILSFDMSDEVFKEILLPSRVDCTVKLVAFKETLCLIQQGGSFTERHCTVWIMKEYGVPTSWSTLFRINLSGGLSSPLGLRENGEVIFATCDGDLVSCDHQSRHIKYLGITFGDRYLYWHTFSTDVYTESLELLNKLESPENTTDSGGKKSNITEGEEQMEAAGS